MLRGQIALVTGASRGIGRGIALQLGSAGATVYITGRRPKDSASADPALPSLEQTAHEITQRGGKGVAVYCDHSNDEDVKRLFEKIGREENDQLDILVNNAYAAVNAIVDATSKKFWELEPTFWDDVNAVGLRNHYFCTVYAARIMVPKRKGLIVNISSAGGLSYLFNVAYGVGKAAVDRMAGDCAQELKKQNVAMISLWPGAVRTELFMSILDKGGFKSKEGNSDSWKNILDQGETTELAGLCIAHLAKDKNLMQKTGRVLLTSDLADEYGVTDIDGKKPSSIRSLKWLLMRSKWERAAAWTPSWIKLPGWMLTASTSKL